MQEYKIKQSLTAFCTACVVVISGCVRDHKDITPQLVTTGNEVTIKVNIPGSQSPSSRSIAGSGGESAVERIDIFVFESGASASSPDILVEHAQGQNISQSTNASDNYTVQFKAQLTTNPDASSVVVLANVPSSMISAAAVAGSEKQAVLEALQYASTYGSDGWKWKSDAGDYTPIPMYGEKNLPSGGISSEMKIEDIDLTRMLARIDIYNQATSDFSLTEVYLVNYNTAGYIAPAWNTVDGTLLGTLPENPMMPSASVPQTGDANKIAYSYSDNAGSGLEGVIYTYEAVKATETDRTNAVCLVVKGIYEGKEYYYRLDFCDLTDASGKLPGDDGYVAPAADETGYMPVYRNHCYRFAITAVEGIGYTNFTEALESVSTLSNLQVALLVVDMTGIIDIVWDSNYYLGVGEKLVMDATGGGMARSR